MIEKSVFMPQGENTTIVQYRFHLPGSESSRPGDDTSLIPHPLSQILFELRPLIAFRDYHSLLHENTAINSHVQIDEALGTIKP